MWDFEHEPHASELAARYQIQFMMPAQCAERLALPADHPDAADIGLVPVAALATIPDLQIIPGCAIAAKGKIRSLLLIRPSDLPLPKIRTVAADTSSRATLAYTQILATHWSYEPVQFLQHAPNLDQMLQSADAALLIGDPALFALEDQAARELRTGQKLIYLDLAEAWIALTGVPWISAVWAMRGAAYNTALAANSKTSNTNAVPLRQVFQDFKNSREHGLQNTETLVQEWSAKLPLPAQTIREYLTENIFYKLDQECLVGLRYFYQRAAETGVLPRYKLER
jgi:chorismate dehydratase